MYANTRKLGDSYGSDKYQVDFGKLPRVLADEVGTRLGANDVDVVRTYLFGSYAAECDERDEEAAERRKDFFGMLKEEYHYEVEIFPISFRGRRLRKEDRNPNDTFEPKEKCVDISLATSMLYFAAIPYAYDIAIAVIGDQDFKPVLQHVRRLGKRVAIASIKGACTPDFSDPRDDARVKDFDIVWLDDLLEKLELKYERHQLECDASQHRGNRKVWTTFHPRKGQKFFCDECRQILNRQKLETRREFVSVKLTDEPTEAAALEASNVGKTITGTVKKLVPNKGFGFIRGENGVEYYFHLTDLISVEFDDLREGLPLTFEIKTEPHNGKAGAADNVRPLAQAAVARSADKLG